MKERISQLVEQAKAEACKMGNHYVGSEHLLLALMRQKDSAFTRYLERHGVFYHQVQEDLMVLFGILDGVIKEEDVQMTQVAQEIIDDARSLAEKSDDEAEKCLGNALLAYENSVAGEMLLRYGVDLEELKDQLADVAGILARYEELCDLAQGSASSLIGREQELAQIMEVLSRKEKANPLLLGDAGVGKSAVVEQLAWLLKKDQVPQHLKGCRIYELNLNALVAGTKYRGDFEEKLQRLLQMLAKYPHIIVFIDEIHMMIGAGKSEGSIDVASVLKPFLARGKLRLIGATTLEEYEKHIEKDRALQRRFHPIVLKEPQVEAMRPLLKQKAKEYGAFHEVTVEADALDAIIAYCERYMPQRRFPDKALDVLDLACVKTTLHGSKIVTRKQVAEAMEQMTHIPFTKRLYHRQQDELKRLFAGQEELADKIVAYLKHLRKEGPNLGVWLFRGEAHSGKRKMAKAIAKLYFAQEEVFALDGRTWKQQIEEVMRKIKRTPFCVLSIHHIEADPALEALLCSAFENGSLETNGWQVSFRHVLIILHDEKQELPKAMHFTKASAGHALGMVQPYLEACFTFQKLSEQHQIKIIQKMLDACRIEVSEEAIGQQLKQSTSLRDAYHKVKRNQLEKAGIG